MLASLTDFKQEKLEGIINLPESLEVTKSILSFFYTSSYVEDSTSLIEHSAEVYFAANKYDIPGLKVLARSKLVSLFGSLESRFACNDEPLTPDLVACVESFLEVVVLAYNNTRDTDRLRYVLVSTAREILRTVQLTTDDNDGWLKCFSLVPAFALDLLKPNSTELVPNISDRSSTSWKWRAAKDCVIFECGQCDTAVTMSKEAWEDNGCAVDKNTWCPNVEGCGGKLVHKIARH